MCTSTVIAMCINKASKGKHLYFSYLAISVLRNLVCLSRLSLTYGERNKDWSTVHKETQNRNAIIK